MIVILNVIWQSVRSPYKVIPAAGWHLSNFMTVQDIADKIGMYSHTEYDTPDVRNVTWIKRCCGEGLDLVDGHKYLPAAFPEELHELGIPAFDPQSFRTARGIAATNTDTTYS